MKRDDELLFQPGVLPMTDFLPPHQGRQSDLGLILTVGRALTRQDIFQLATEGSPSGPTTTPPLQRIGVAHRRAARLLAEGKSITEVAFLVGRTPQSIGDRARNDPSFKELIAYYERQQEDSEAIERAMREAKAVHIHDLAMDGIETRLEDPDKLAAIPTSELRQIAQFTGDRTYLPPKVAERGSILPAQITFNIAGAGLNPPPPAGGPIVDHVDHLDHLPKPKPDPDP